jgi:hypothetical protein
LSNTYIFTFSVMHQPVVRVRHIFWRIFLQAVHILSHVTPCMSSTRNWLVSIFIASLRWLQYQRNWKLSGIESCALNSHHVAVDIRWFAAYEQTPGKLFSQWLLSSRLLRIAYGRHVWIFFDFQFLYQVLSFGMIVSSALMIWKGLMLVTGSESPIVVVLR